MNYHVHEYPDVGVSLVQTVTISSSIDSEGYSANSDVEDSIVSTSSGQAGTMPLSATDSEEYSANSMDVVENCALSGQRSLLVNSEAANSGTNVEAKIVGIDGDQTDSDLMNYLQVGRKFNSFKEVQELLDKLKVCNHPMRVFRSQSVDDCNNKRVKAISPLEPVVEIHLLCTWVCPLWPAPEKKQRYKMQPAAFS